MFERSYIEILKKRFKEPRKFIQVITGPRQVGKTTLINQLLPQLSIDYMYESADTVASANATWVQQIWETARLKMKISGSSEFLLVIDEIQKTDNWSEVVKLQWDRDTRENNNIKIVLLGSSRLLIQKGLTESLAGRFEMLYFSHWSFPEMETAFGWTIQQYIYFGGYPGSTSLINDEERWKSYINDSLVETSISKDILMLTRIDKPALLKRLFELGTSYSGKILSFNKIMGELQNAGNTTTLAHYLDLLSESGLLAGLEKYSGNMIRKRSSSPKFQVYNNALFSARGYYRLPDVIIDHRAWGRFAESAVGSHLLNHRITEKYNLYYWREGNEEVDFIIEKNGLVVALEVKSGRRQTNSGISKFAEKYHPAKVLIVGTGGISIEEFLRLNPGQLF